MVDQSLDKRLSHASRSKVLIVIQPSVSHYRAPFVRALLDQNRLDLQLVGRVIRTVVNGSPAPADDELLDKVESVSRVVMVKNVYWDRGLVSLVCRTDADAVVLEGNVYGLSNWVAIAVARMRRRKVILWGHGWKRPEHGVRLALRKFFYRRANGHLTYGEWAPAYASSVGLDVSAFLPVFNSVYPRAWIEAQTPRTGRRSPAGVLSLIYSGRLTPRHRADDAIEAVHALREAGHGVRLTVVGDGAEASRLRDLAGGVPQIVFHGAIYDADELARLYAEADFAVSPGATGLNVIQALGFGVPVIAASGDPQSGPEIEAVQDAVTGVLYPSENGVFGLCAALEDASRIDDAAYASLSGAGLDVVATRYTSEAHAMAVIDALSDLLRR